MECRAADCVPIDLPCTYRSPDVIAADLALSTQSGFMSKCAVCPEQVDPINRATTPSMREVEQARELVAAYEAQKGRAPSQAWIDAPERNNAGRLLARHAAIETFGDVAAR